MDTDNMRPDVFHSLFTHTLCLSLAILPELLHALIQKAAVFAKAVWEPFC